MQISPKRGTCAKKKRRKTLRTVCLVISCMSLPTGCGMLWMGYANGSALPITIGMTYILASALCFLAWIFLRRRTGIQSASFVPRCNSSGMALPVCLALMSLLAGVAFHALLAAEANLRLARSRHVDLLLRAACIEAVFSTLQDLRVMDQRQPRQAYERDFASPSGVRVRTWSKEIDRASLPPPLRRPDAPLFGHMYRIRCQAYSGSASRRIQAFSTITPAGDIRLLSWTASR